MRWPTKRGAKDVSVAAGIVAVILAILGGIAYAIYVDVHHDNQGNTRCHRIHGKTDDNGIHCYIGVDRVKDTRP